MRAKSFLIVMLILVVLAGCNADSMTTTPAENSLATGYPASELNSVQTAYPAGSTQEASSVDALLATQDPTLGSVEGTLLLKGKPIANVSLYLGAIVTDDTGRELVAGYDRTSSLRATTDAKGYFVFLNVPEGRYGLILDLVSQAYLLDFPDGTQSVLLTVKKGEATQMDVLDFSELPGL